MPRAKSDDGKTSAELNAEIKKLQEQIAAKRKAEAAAKKREDAEARQAREMAEREFNRDFVERAKEVHFSDYEDDGRSVYEVIKYLIRPPKQEEPAQEEPMQAGPEIGDDLLGLPQDYDRNGLALSSLLAKRDEQEQ